MDLPAWVDHVQWPAMAFTVAATYLAGSQAATRRKVGFGLFVASNVLWVAWGLYAAAWALIVLQGALFVLNVRGAKRNRETEERETEERETEERETEERETEERETEG